FHDIFQGSFFSLVTISLFSRFKKYVYVITQMLNMQLRHAIDKDADIFIISCIDKCLDKLSCPL
ncbi:MAG: hypothetical protein UH071_02965, partial [Paludibacteraceae bacterium]|nr:hypothetical protein [Paludibacteraceae bacterium]